MAHKTLVGGTAYEVSGGKTLIGGTAYSIKNGKTLVGGAAYEIGFESFATSIDLGTFTTDSNPFMGYKASIPCNGYPADYKSLTHALVDGIVYPMTPTNFTSTVFGYYIGDSKWEVRFNANGNSIAVTQFLEGTHTVALGYA